MKDLVLLVPDNKIEQTLLGLLTRTQALGIRSLELEKPVVHPHRDPGVYHTAREMLAPYERECRYALVVFDAAWGGAPSSDAGELAAHVERNCRCAWGERVRCIVIVPEIEAWVWTESPRVSEALGWSSWPDLRAWLQRNGLWAAGERKPADPKRAFEDAVRERQLPPSSAIFSRIARTASFSRCTDPSFLHLAAALRQWFSAAREPAG